MRWAIYARYSTDLQDRTSIDDQVSLCREWIARQGGNVVVVYADPEISGALAVNRPDFQRMRRDAAAGRFEGVVAEALDRFSRNLSDTDQLRTHMEHHSVRLSTVAEGDITLLHVGLKGTMNALYLQDLALKIRRGMKGNADRGLSAGGLAYGYRVGARPGERLVDEAQKKVIIGIFEAIAAGEGARAIARRLNGEGIPAPGRALGWRATTILGSAKRANGILQNLSYLGRVVFGRQKRQRDPATGRIVMRPVPREQWHVVERPEWRIVSQDLWDRAHARLRVVDRMPLHKRRRPPRLLSGLISCGLCGSPMIVKSNELLVCSRHRDIGGCDHDRSISAAEVETRVLAAIRTALDHPDAVSEFVATYHAERERLRRDEVDRRRRIEQKAARARQAIDGVVRLAIAGLGVEELAAYRPQFEGYKQALAEAEADLARLCETKKVVRINPQAPAVYRRKLEELAGLLAAEGADAARAREIIRAMARQVKVYPDMLGGRRRIEMAGELRVMVALSAGESIGDIVGSGGGS